MDESVAAYIADIAPGEKSGEWHQRSFGRALAEWATTDVRVQLIYEPVLGGAVGYHIWSESDGVNGYPAEHYFAPNLDPHFLDGLDYVDDPESHCESLYEIWMEHLQGVIQEDVDASLFTPKEMGVFYAHRHPRETERMAADGLGLSVGNYRGKVARVKEKLERARATIELADLAEADTQREWTGNGYEAPPEVMYELPESKFPVNATHPPDNIDDYPTEGLVIGEPLFGNENGGGE